jgi:hypothetical protein
MPRLNRTVFRIVLMVTTLSSLTLYGACKQKEQLVVPPFLPPAYYDCLEARGSDLAIAYFSNYGNMSRSEFLYNDHYLVFKNQIVETWMIKELDQGWIWIEGNIKCLLTNVSTMKTFKLGDKIDVVGYNQGVIYGMQGLLFKDCIVMAAGSVQLPSSGEAVAVSLY